MALACAASMLSGCAIPRTWEKISPDPEGYWDNVSSATSAHRRGDGAVVVCVTGTLAAPHPLIGSRAVEAFSLILPADTTGRVSMDIHPSLRRYTMASADVGKSCEDSATPATPLPIHTVRRSDHGYPKYDAFPQFPDAALADLIDHRSNPPAVYVFNRAAPHSDEDPKIVYVAPEARFDGARAVLMDLGRRPVKGNPAYVVVLPFAVVFDVVVTVPVFILSWTFLNAVGLTS